jgi:toxin FitB
MIVVDTNVLREALRSQPSTNVMAWLTTNASSYRVPTVVLADMWAGVDVVPTGARKNRLTAAIQQITNHAKSLDRLLPVTHDVARAFGTVIAARQKKGLSIKPMDALIAATAIAHDATLATRNINHFTGIGLTLINPWL